MIFGMFCQQILTFSLFQCDTHPFYNHQRRLSFLPHPPFSSGTIFLHTPLYDLDCVNVLY